MEMVQAFDICRKSTSILLIDLDLIRRQTDLWGDFTGHPHSSVVDAKSLPGLINLRSAFLSINVLLHEVALELLDVVVDIDVSRHRRS